MKSIKIPTLIAGLCTTAAGTYASSDYAPAVWRPNCGQYYTSGNGHKFMVCHDMEGYYASTISYFQNCNTTASIHYLVNGKQDASSDYAAGQITQMVTEANYAWHVRCWNTHSAGTEHEGFASNPAWYTDAMYNATGVLQRHLCDAYGRAKDRNHIVGHDAWQSSAWRSYASANYGIDPNCNTHTDPGDYWDWSKLMGIVKNTTSSTAAGPDAVAWADGRIDVFARGGGDDIYHKYYVRGTGWLPDGHWQGLGGDAIGGPGACSWAPDRLDVFVRGGGDSMYHKYWNGTDWLPDNNWENLGGTLTSGPDACSWGSGRIDVVVRGGGNAIYHKAYNSGSGWTGYANIGGTSTDEPAICTWGSDRLDVFCRGTDNGLYHNYYANGAWQRSSNWENLGGTLTSGPDACTWGSGRIDVVVRGGNNHIYHKYYISGQGWLPSGGFEDLGGNSSSDPAICTWGPGRLDVFYRGTDKALWHKWYDSSNGGWSGWENLGGTLY